MGMDVGVGDMRRRGGMEWAGEDRKWGEGGKGEGVHWIWGFD